MYQVMQRCAGCGKGYWPTQAWIHQKCATNAATNGANATNEGSEDRGNGCGAEAPTLTVTTATPVSGGTVVVARTANRRTREAYNAYQREYMRKERARKRALA